MELVVGPICSGKPGRKTRRQGIAFSLWQPDLEQLLVSSQPLIDAQAILSKAQAWPQNDIVVEICGTLQGAKSLSCLTHFRWQTEATKTACPGWVSENRRNNERNPAPQAST